MTNIAFDLDGVLVKRTVSLTYKEVARAHQSNINPPEDCYIISARGEYLRPHTEKWLERKGIEYKELILFNDWEKFKDKDWKEKDLLQAKWKADKINKLNLDYFVEDRKEVIDYLEQNCKAIILNPKEFEKKEV